MNETYETITKAVWSGKTEEVLKFIYEKADLEYIDPQYKTTALNLAAMKGYTSVVQVLLDAVPPPDVHVRDPFRNKTPLENAIFRNHFETALFIMHFTETGSTKEFEADKYSALLRNKIKEQADIEKHGQELIETASKGAAFKVNQLLKKHSAAPYGLQSVFAVRTEEGQSVLMKAAELGHTSVCQILIQAGVNPSEINLLSNKTAFDYAIGKGHHETSKELRKLGGKPATDITVDTNEKTTIEWLHDMLNDLKKKSKCK